MRGSAPTSVLISEHPPAPRVRLLILEHSQGDIELLLCELRHAGFDVEHEVAETEEQFRERLLHESFDAVLSDYHLPHWTGLDAFDEMRGLGIEIPFLLVTGTLAEEAAVECIKRGINNYVLKEHLSRLPVALERALQEKAFREEQTRAAAVLRESEASFRLLFGDSPLPMWVYDHETLAFLQVNDAAVEHYGYSREEFLRMKLTDIRVPEEASRLVTWMAGHPEIPAHAGIWRHRLKNGQFIQAEISQHRLPFVGRDAVLVVAVDVTERMRAEQALRESEARARELVENTTYAIFRSTADGHFLDFNPALVSLLGIRAGSDLRSINLVQDVFRFPEQYASFLSFCRGKGRVAGFEAEWRRKDGANITVRLSGRLVETQKGLDVLEVFAEDVTELRAMEKQLQQAQKFEAIGQLAGGVAHDFNNVVGAILGWAEMGLEQTRDQPQLLERFGKICEQAERAAALTRELLAFARQQVLQPCAIDLNHVVTGLLSFLDKVIGRDIEVKVATASSVDLIRADPTQIEQVLMNLCLNARDAMPEGGRMLIETEVVEIDDAYSRHCPYAQPGRYAVLSVSDTGIGMDAATRERIFEPFFTTKKLGKGTGLGLATVYGIVKQHGGFVQAYSEPGQGSLFRVYLPVLTERMVPAKGKTPPLAAAPVPQGTETILLAEDHDGVREMAWQALSNLGYRVLTATNGEEALKVCESETPALAILDVIMPKLNGPAAYSKLQARFPLLPAIFTTGYTAEQVSLEKHVQEGGVVLQKPYSPTVLGRIVREVLDRTTLALNRVAE